MKRVLTLTSAALLLGACGSRQAPSPAAEAPPPARVENVRTADLVTPENPRQFPVVAAQEHRGSDDLNATGVISADVSRTVPVVSLASGRVIEVDARLGDTVRQGQLLMKVRSADISGASAEFRSARADEALAQAQLDRATLLFDKGAIARKDLEIAQDVHAKARISVENATEKLRLLGGEAGRAVVAIRAPVSGVITEQNVTTASGVKTLDNSPSLFTISDLSRIWVICDVYENDLSHVRLGDSAEIRLNAYPDRVFVGRVSNIGQILDPALRSAKVRIELPNPGLMRLGMFVTATFHTPRQKVDTVVPASAVLHLHDRDWVYVPEGSRFRRLEVVGGAMLPNRQQEIRSGLSPGQPVVSNALMLQNSTEE
ncbi:MAG TPA: efflux RND transporter periplasmic adaptor subunit [Solibacterales bacterium]|nr:efflux RND transporter periplasmic adaptor subunit [Bryobacterales bacterium]